MKLTEEQLRRALDIYENHDGSVGVVLAAVIEDFWANTFKPIAPQRDYRKELWVGVRTHCDDPGSADAALADFDVRFGEQE